MMMMGLVDLDRECATTTAATGSLSRTNPNICADQLRLHHFQIGIDGAMPGNRQSLTIRNQGRLQRRTVPVNQTPHDGISSLENLRSDRQMIRATRPSVARRLRISQKTCQRAGNRTHPGGSEASLRALTASTGLHKNKSIMKQSGILHRMVLDNHRRWRLLSGERIYQYAREFLDRQIGEVDVGRCGRNRFGDIITFLKN